MFRHEENVARAFTGGLLQAFFRRGPDRRVMRFDLAGIDDATRVLIFNTFIGATRKPLLIDPIDDCWEVALADDSLDWTHRFVNYNAQVLALESLR